LSRIFFYLFWYRNLALVFMLKSPPSTLLS
jgi:hypothetical protein